MQGRKLASVDSAKVIVGRKLQEQGSEMMCGEREWYHNLCKDDALYKGEDEVDLRVVEDALA